MGIQMVISETAISLVAKHINERNNKSYAIPIIGSPENTETPQIFEIIPFDEIDKAPRILGNQGSLSPPRTL